MEAVYNPHLSTFLLRRSAIYKRFLDQNSLFLLEMFYGRKIKNSYSRQLDKNMESRKIDEKIEILENSYCKLYTLENAQLFEEITKAISEHVKHEDEDKDSRDGVLSKIPDSLQEEFEELVGISNDKRHFIKALTKIFTLLLNSNVDSIEKIKKIIEMAIETTLKIRQEPRRL